MPMGMRGGGGVAAAARVFSKKKVLRGREYTELV
jgi:hypothetical protein